MEVYSASDGAVFQLEKSLGEYETIDTLNSDVSTVTGVTAENILLFLDDGRQVTLEVLHNTWERGGEGSASNGSRQIVYLFDRETFWTDAELTAAKFQEQVLLPPQLPLSALSDMNQIQHPFLIASDHISHLHSLFTAQSHALRIAYANLFLHLTPVLTDFESFSIRAEQDIDTESRLLRGYQGDMALLPKIMVHEALRRKDKDRDKDKSLADYVNAGKMEQVVGTCRTSHSDHVTRYNSLVTDVEELSAQSEAEKRAFEDRVTVVNRQFEDCLDRIEMALSQAQGLVEHGADSMVQDLIILDQAMREDLIALTHLKNDFTLDLHLHLRQVSAMQSKIPQIVDPIGTLDAELQSRTAFPHLSRLQLLPFAYASSVVEVVRRKEFASWLTEWTSRLQRTLSRFTQDEMDKRQKIKDDSYGQLPFQIPALDDSMTVRFEITAKTGDELLKGLDISREDIDRLMHRVDELYHDPEVLQHIHAGDSNPIESLQHNLDNIVAQLETRHDELDRKVEKSVLLSSQSNSKAELERTITARVRIVEEERDRLESQLREQELAHERQERNIEDRHENQTATLQNRQAELQEELFRLRTDLSDEMLARQALSTQLEEQARDTDDRQREYEDQADLLSAVQAELAQEKHRATDLGVRLQEALLDVDGLRNAETTLIGQLQTLQDERSKSMQSLSDAQCQADSLESQLAGIKAELEATTGQLLEARSERDAALKSQSAEAERMMRDHIAEADGDRAVLEHQNLTLTKQLEDIRVEMAEKLTSAKNSSLRQADGLKAELHFTKAQLRDAQRRETVLADELAMSKDTAQAMSQVTAHQSDVSRDAVALSSKYFDTCERLLTAINASSTISGTESKLLTKSRSPPRPESTSEGAMKESAMIRSLSQAQSFDLTVFSEAVQKTITMVKKLSRVTKGYKDLARHKISIANFAKGDLALFLPTRHARTSWAAFNLLAPHHFLHISTSLREKVEHDEWLIGRIVSTEEAVAQADGANQANPHGLAEGIRYYTHHVSVYDPKVRSERRSTLPSASSLNRIEDSTPRRGRSISVDDTPGPLAVEDPIGEMMQQNSEQSRDDYTSAGEPSSPTPKPELDGSTPQLAPALTSSPLQSAQQTPTLADSPSVPRAPNASPVVEKTSNEIGMDESDEMTIPSSSERSIPPISSTLNHQRSVSKESNHLIAPHLLPRPTSVASTHSSMIRKLSLVPNAPKAAPAMAITTSNEGASTSLAQPLPFDMSRKVIRKPSVHDMRPSVEDPFRPSPLRVTSSSSVNHYFSDDPHREMSNGTSPGSSGFQSPPPVTNGTKGASDSAAGTVGTSPGGLTASKLFRGFSFRQRTTSNPGAEAKPTAMDMLKRFEGGP